MGRLSKISQVGPKYNSTSSVRVNKEDPNKKIRRNLCDHRSWGTKDNVMNTMFYLTVGKSFSFPVGTIRNDLSHFFGTFAFSKESWKGFPIMSTNIN